MSNAREQTKEVYELVSAVRPLFVGQDREVQGAALADLLAMWLAGHVMRGDPKRTKRIREDMLQRHLDAVRGLIEPNYKMLVEPQLKRKTQ